MSPLDDLRAAAKLADLLKALQVLRQQTPRRRLKWGISANVSLDLLGYALEKHGYLHGAHSEVLFGDFNDHLGNLRRFAELGVQQVLLIQLFDHLLPALEARQSEWDEFCAHWEQEFSLLLEQLPAGMTLIMPEFHSLFGPNSGLEQLNLRLRTQQRVVLVDSAEIVAQLGRERAFSPRYYYQHQAPYTLEYWERLVSELFARRPELSGRYRKTLVLDADNTLWGGTVGEDGLEGLKLDPHSYPGNVFWAVQQRLLEMQRRGVLLALCSKNNPQDALEVLEKHPHCLLKPEQFVSMRINWQDKVSNLEDLAHELNLGLESLVFLDDSSLECEQVRQLLPEVETIQVPQQLFLYPGLVSRLAASFPVGNSGKTAQYAHRRLVEGERDRHTSQQDFLQSLQMKLSILRNPMDLQARLVELSQKTNQFNLTTVRYTESEVEKLAHDPDSAIFALDLSDRFGAHGVIGLLSWRQHGEVMEVENFLLSCRVLGRGVEFALWEQLKRVALQSGARFLQADYRAGTKNVQVKDFYLQLGLQLIAPERYRADLADWEFPTPEWIEVSYSHE